MCVVSMVSDDFSKRQQWPWNQPAPYQPFTEPYTQKPLADLVQRLGAPELAELRKLIAEFREAMAAAKRVDVLTNQPDCADPAKLSLEKRVAALEKQLNKRPRKGGLPNA